MTTMTTTKGSIPSFPEVDDDEGHELLVRDAVRTALTAKQREAVELFFFEGQSQSEIARRLGVSQQVVQRRLYGASRGGAVVGGALAKLREVLAPYREELRVRS